MNPALRELVESASDKQESAARTLRPKLRRLLDHYLRSTKTVPLKHPSLALRINGDIDPSDVEATLATLKIDRTVRRSRRFSGGSRAAHLVLDAFLAHKLKGYAEGTRDPALEGTSTLAAYLHFGQISPLAVALKVRAARRGSDDDRAAYPEELLVCRELPLSSARCAA